LRESSGEEAGSQLRKRKRALSRGNKRKEALLDQKTAIFQKKEKKNRDDYVACGKGEVGGGSKEALTKRGVCPRMGGGGEQQEEGPIANCEKKKDEGCNP